MPIERSERGDSSVLFEPISVRIPDAVRMTGFSRSRIYELIGTGELKIAKDRRSTLIIVSSLRDAVARRITGSLLEG